MSPLSALVCLLYALVVPQPVPMPRVEGLSGWWVQNGKPQAWKAEGSTIACIAPGGGYLTMDREYGDFELTLDYRLPPGGNSGIGVHYPPGGHPSEKGIEIQLLDDADPKYRNLKPSQYNGSIYRLVPPKAHPAKPAGEWNHLVVRCQGPRIQVRVNDTLVQDVNVDEHPRLPTTEPADSPLAPLSKRPRRGCVGLQSHGDPVSFRDVRIREL